LGRNAAITLATKKKFDDSDAKAAEKRSESG